MVIHLGLKPLTMSPGAAVLGCPESLSKSVATYRGLLGMFYAVDKEGDDYESRKKKRQLRIQSV